MRMRLEWNVNRSGRTCWRSVSMAGISVSIVVLELGTICPIRKTLFINRLLEDFKKTRQPRIRIQDLRPITKWITGNYCSVHTLQAQPVADKKMQC
jgi:hypothetical protein